MKNADSAAQTRQDVATDPPGDDSGNVVKFSNVDPAQLNFAYTVGGPNVPYLFVSAEDYSTALLHELTHSAGHEMRLARESITEASAIGSAAYSNEALIAETGGAYLCGEAGISSAVIANQAAYIVGWLAKW
jgi:Zincin-like metallopeptidase